MKRSGVTFPIIRINLSYLVAEPKEDCRWIRLAFFIFNLFLMAFMLIAFTTMGIVFYIRKNPRKNSDETQEKEPKAGKRGESGDIVPANS